MRAPLDRPLRRVRHGVPYLRDLDPMAGTVIRSSKETAIRYERDKPGELVHVDVKKLGKIPAGGGWRAHGRAAVSADKKTDTCAGFLLRAAVYFAECGITTIERVMTECHQPPDRVHLAACALC